jgi:CRP-like cAMP-binding protein
LTIKCGNKLLAQLGDGCEQIVDRMERVNLPAGEVICEPGQALRFVCFPTTAVLSSVVTLEGGEVVEAATIGNEGMAGVASLVDDYASPYRVVQRVDGWLFRMPTSDFRALLEGNSQLREIMGRYVLTLLQQHAQNAACNLHHNIEGRMSRWLLTTSDRVGRDGFQVTQEFLSEMLGVSRQSVNSAAGELQGAGMIAYSRGNLRITDRHRLEEAACECYRVTKEAYDRLMRPTAA